MSSLFLGHIGEYENEFEIHALTNNKPFREYKQSEISDINLFNELLKSRFRILQSGRPIYCTAINPDVKNKIEANPHDYRDGTVHFIAIDKKGEISCGLSVAVDTGEMENGQLIGLPLENKWRSDGISPGQNLDKFRSNYLRTIYKSDKTIQAWQMAELYRHFKVDSEKNNLASRLGVITGCYHLLVREAIKKSLTASHFWVFDAIPSYFNLYKYSGPAVLRDFTLETPAKLISPNKGIIKKVSTNGVPGLLYNNKIISRNIDVPLPKIKDGNLTFTKCTTPFLDGIVDLKWCEGLLQYSPLTLDLKGMKGYTLKDRIKLRIGLSVIGKRAWEEDYHQNNYLSNKLNKYLGKKIGINHWSFNSIGSI